MPEQTKYLSFASITVNANGDFVALMSRDKGLAKSLKLAAQVGASKQFNLKAGVVAFTLRQVIENLDKLAVVLNRTDDIKEAVRQFDMARVSLEAKLDPASRPVPSVALRS